jgi:class 3 adenylate cyclase
MAKTKRPGTPPAKKGKSKFVAPAATNFGATGTPKAPSPAAVKFRDAADSGAPEKASRRQVYAGAPAREQVAESVAEPPQMYDPQYGAADSASAAGSIDDVGSVASAGTADSDLSLGTGTENSAAWGFHTDRGCVATFDRRVPFSAQVLAMVLIPITCLVVFSSLRLSQAVDTVNYIEAHRSVLLNLGACQHKVMFERGRSSQYTGNPGATTKMNMDAARKLTDAPCADLVASVHAAPDGFISTTFYADVRRWLHDLSVTRHRIDRQRIALLDQLHFFNNMVFFIDTGRGYFASRDIFYAEATHVFELKFAWQAANALGHGRGTGAAVLALRESGNVSTGFKDELSRTAALYFYTQDQFKQIASADGQAFYERTAGGVIGKRAEKYLAALAADPNGYVITKSEWFDTLTASLAGRTVFDVLLIDKMGAGPRLIAVNEGAQMAIGLVLSIAAAVVIVLLQFRVQRRVDARLASRRRMQASAQAFIPKKFLRLAGCVSILQVSAGANSEVAVSMLASSIRNFSSISRSLDDKDLFVWMQRYFTRMTSVTEKNGGFVDKLSGDSIFAIFTSPMDCVQCAVSMQAAAKQLTHDAMADSESHIFVIGVGLHHAVVTVGFLGNNDRVTTTLVSRDIRTATRLNELTLHYGVNILSSQLIIEQLGTHQFATRRLGTLDVVDMDSIDIVDVFQSDTLALKQHKEATKELFAEAVELREAADADGASKKFKSIVEAARSRSVEDVAAQRAMHATQQRDCYCDAKQAFVGEFKQIIVGENVATELSVVGAVCMGTEDDAQGKSLINATSPIAILGDANRTVTFGDDQEEMGLMDASGSLADEEAREQYDEDEEEDEEEAAAEQATCDRWLDVLDKHVSFSVQVVALLLVPVTLLVVFAGIQFSASLTMLQYVNDHEAVMLNMGACQHKIMFERGRSSQYSGGPSAATKKNMDAARKLTDAPCSALVSTVHYAPDAAVSVGWYPQLRKWLHDLSVTRYEIDARDIATLRQLQFFNHMIFFIDEGRGLFANEDVMRPVVKTIIELKFAWQAANAMGHSRGTGASLLALREKGLLTDGIRDELSRTASSYFTAQGQFVQIASPAGAAFYRRTAGSAVGRRAEKYLAGLAADPDNYTITKAEWFDTTTASLTGRTEFDVELIASIRQFALDAITVESVQMVLAVVLSLLSAGFIVYAQLRVQRRIEASVEASNTIQQAVQSFIPDMFLELTLCSSILVVKAGTNRRVAVTMMSSDIGDFSAISQGLANTELFLWLQRYFGLMSQLTADHQGYIDKFIGDSIFAIFRAPADAVLCSVEMHTSCAQLSVDITTNGGDHVVAIYVGIHHAPVAVGFLGDDARVSCTLISSHMMDAMKLNALAKEYDAKTVVSEAVASRIRGEDVATRRWGLMEAPLVSGITATEIFQNDPLPLKKQKEKVADRFDAAVALADAYDYAGARDAFELLMGECTEAGVNDTVIAAKLARIGAMGAGDSDALITPDRSTSFSPLQPVEDGKL